MSPQHKGLIPATDQARIRAALAARDASYDELVAAVLDAAEHGASVRELAEFTGLSTNTITRWKRGERA
ncbi:helix-turn-helix domain-containing protein [Demequina gelatinilytica]|uniref:helix-turn-helix domain-containing protein n=1 Tax=Demequina gelatinilytica TaxID=1638980 RepID=UPI000780E05E|nr:helix-turn-helix domain-containing protein [Demequina gelatinilytica]